MQSLISDYVRMLIEKDPLKRELSLKSNNKIER